MAKIELSISEDFEIDKLGICDRCGIGASEKDISRANKLYSFLTSKSGVNLMRHLHKIKGMIVLCQAPDPSGTFDFVRIILSGDGLLMQNIRTSSVVFETAVSCLYVSCVWSYRKDSFNSANSSLCKPVSN